MNASIAPAANAATAAASTTPSPSLSALAGQAGNVLLTRVSLAYIDPRFKLYLRFGEPARTLRLDRWRRCAVFLPRAMFCRVRWEANDYGTIRWQLMVMQAATPLDDVQRIPGVRPGARLLLHAEGDARACRAGTHRRHRRAGHRAHRRVARVLAHAGQPTRGTPAAARTPPRHAAWLAGRAFHEHDFHDRPCATSSLAPARSHRAGGLRHHRPRCAGLGRIRAPLPRLTYNPSDSVAVGWYRIEPLDHRPPRCHVRCPWASS